MSIFTKPLSQLTYQDLDDLVTGRAVENVRLEFKRDVPGRDETIKKLSSFANTYGGFMVLGPEASSKDGRIIGLPGVDPKPNYKQTVVQWCADAVTPFIDVDVSDPISIPDSNGKVCYVLFTRESDLAPHFLNDRKGVYVRTNEFSKRFEPRLANETELRHLFDRRKVIRDRRTDLIKRARERFRTFIDRRYRELSNGKEIIGCRFDLSIIPRFPAIPVCDQALLISLISEKRLDWRQVGFPRNSFDRVSQHESAIILRPGSNFSILEANIWGLLFYATEIERQEETFSGIHLNQYLGQVLVFIEHSRMITREFSYFGPLLLQMRMEAMCGVPWVYFEGRTPMNGPASELDDEVLFNIYTTSEELDQKPDKIMIDILRYVFFAMNWPDVANNDQKLESFIKMGYSYNYWPVPDNLRK